MNTVRKTETKLRPGNFILKEKEAYRITTLSLEEIVKKMHGVEGIPINEDWIESFGFYYLASTSTTHTYFLKGIQVHLSEGHAQVFYRQRMIDTVYFVHELQNLFYTLTSEELIYRDLQVA
ncbi:MAG: hypothetical protein ACFCUU_01760 [Cyclobacteriaceae bacterium]